ncbi:hypothetical protein KUTeg_009315 [Tegillarca granosa]|uniref:Uncharacterized protein n=1 Tax=Tegillarca granosa TaxID=220873 RepID=A0ABQ9F700_TEGGR|nr:hypothetical protein KUTeg_009315 [Tegillarca granosa]
MPCAFSYQKCCIDSAFEQSYTCLPADVYSMEKQNTNTSYSFLVVDTCSRNSDAAFSKMCQMIEMSNIMSLIPVFWPEIDTDVLYACERLAVNILPRFREYKNVFCYLCNPQPLNGSVISSCNMTGLWKTYNSNLESACMNMSLSYVTHPYKNRFCQLCNLSPFYEGALGVDSGYGSPVVPDNLGGSTKRFENTITINYRSIFALSSYQGHQSDKKNNNDELCDVSQVQDKTNGICRNISCYPENVHRLHTETFLTDITQTAFNFTIKGETIAFESRPSQRAFYLPSVISKLDYKHRCHFYQHENFTFEPEKEFRSSYVSKLLLCRQIQLNKNEFIINIEKTELFLSNLGYYLNITNLKLREMDTKLKIHPGYSVTRVRDTTSLFTFKLFTLTGISWIFQIIDSFLPLSAFSFIVTIFNGFQGLFVFLSYICNKRVFNLYKTLFKDKRKTDSTLATNSSTKTTELNLTS